ncbi:MAG TPA: DUF5667 domain-containing protein [Frankiaceae bacterium]|nr:DUF5667 domain-containing protein [Frankiaceae bacterium]
MRRSARLAEEFAAALEGSGVASARRDPALAPLLSLAQGLQAVPLAAAPDFRDTLRQRLLAVATVAPSPAAVPSPVDRARTWVEGWRVQRAMQVAAASMAGVVALTGVSVGASRSVPGDALYGMKRSAEGVQLSLARNEVNRGKRHLQHAETRLHEVARIVGEDIALGPAPTGPGQITVAFGGSKSARVAEGLHAMDDSTRDGTRLLFEAYTQEQDEAVLRHVQEFTARQREHLGAVISALPAEAYDDAEASLSLVSNLHLRATQLIAVGTCGAENCAALKPVAPSPGATTPPTPVATPTYDDLGPVPCTCPGDPGAEPTPEPTPSPSEQAPPSDPPAPSDPPPTNSPSPSPSTPSPTKSRYPVPSQVPTPVASPLQDVIEEVEEVLPTPLPTIPPLPGVTAPLVPGQ